MERMVRVLAMLLLLAMLASALAIVAVAEGENAEGEETVPEAKPDHADWMLLPGGHTSDGKPNTAWQTSEVGRVGDRPEGVEFYPQYDAETGELIPAASFWIEFEYYRDDTTVKPLEIRMRNKTQQSLFVIRNNTISLGTNLQNSTLDPELAVISQDGWNHIRVQISQTSAIEGGTVDHQYRAEIYVNGEHVGGGSAVKENWEAHGWGLYDAEIVDGELVYSSENYAAFRMYFYGGEFFYTSGKLNTNRALLWLRNACAYFSAEPRDEIYPIDYELGYGRLPYETVLCESDSFASHTWTPIEGYDYHYDLITTRNYYVVSETAQALGTPVRVGCDFLGWYIDPDFRARIEEIAAYEMGKMTLFAHFDGSYRVSLTEGGEYADYGKMNGLRLPDTSASWLGSNGTVYEGGSWVDLAADTDFAAYGFSLAESATLRTLTPEGICFTTSIGADVIAMLRENGVRHSVGTLIVPQDLLGETAPTVAAMTAAGIPYLDLTADEVGISPERNGSYTFRATLSGILPQNYARSFTAVSYLKVGDAYAYTDAASATLWQMALEALASPALGAAEKALLTGYLDHVLVLDESLRVANSTKDYAAPYNVNYANGILTVAKKTGVFEENEMISIVIDGTVYIGGWTVSNGKIVGTYIPQ